MMKEKVQGEVNNKITPYKKKIINKQTGVQAKISEARISFRMKHKHSTLSFTPIEASQVPASKSARGKPNVNM